MRPQDDEAFWVDNSEGLLQQTVRWSPEWIGWARANDLDPAEFPGSEMIETIMEKYRNPAHAIDRALPQLIRAWENADGDALDALCLYNRPNANPKINKNRQRYADALEMADRILAGEPVAEVLELR